MSAADPVSPRRDDNPYKGQASYTVEDAYLFFGRERESTELLSRILASRVTVVHAASGAGKTSLLNARIVPGLEGQGWFPVVSTPGNDPAAEIRRNTLRTLFPPPEAERLALTLAARTLGVDANATLGRFLEVFDQLVADEPALWSLARPILNSRATDLQTERKVPFDSSHGIIKDYNAATPYLCRVIRRTVDVARYAEHLVSLYDTRRAAVSTVVDEATRLGDLDDWLGKPETSRGYREFVAEVASATTSLVQFFVQLCQRYGSHYPRFGIVLILDQFEEVFTRFAGRPKSRASRASKGVDLALDWHLRDALFKELGAMLGPRTPERAADDAGNAPRFDLPVRYVFSLRDDYVGRLGPLRRMVEGFDQTFYRLGWLSLADAEDAIERPAAARGHTVSADCVDAIQEELLVEDREVQPGPLQIVCQHMWETHRRRFESATLITAQVFDPDGVEAVWEQFFDGIFRSGAFDTRMALDLLAPLITSRGTRNIVERSRLVNVRFWHPKWLAALLQLLEDRRILRKERQQETEFFQITHEFLLDPALRALENDQDYRLIDRAFNALTSVGYERRSEFELDRDDFDTVGTPEMRKLLEWKPWMCEVMLRSALAHGVDRETVHYWAQAYSETAVPLEQLLDAPGPEGRRLLTTGELRELDAEPVVYARLTEAQRDRVFESLLASGQPMPHGLLSFVARSR